MPLRKQAQEGREKDARIQVSENGPYIVSGWIPLTKLTISTDVEGYPQSYVVGEEVPSRRDVCFVRAAGSPEQTICDGNAR